MARPGGLLLVALVILALAGVAASAAEEPYQEIRVFLSPNEPIQDLLEIHPDLELMGLGDGDVHLLSRPSLTQEIRSRGWKVEIIHEDLESHYAALQGATTDYGIWHTYDETVDELFLLHSEFPSLTTAPFSLGQTIEGREIWAIKVSDNPNVDEDEPEVLFDGVHHAREIMTVELNLWFARYLCENHGTDPTASFLVDNREIWFIPIVNGDGFVYNETTNPNGGGMWRKNRRDNPGSSCFGVDNNRNYPYHWGENGSSGNPCDETFRGASPASEPENQALINFINGREIVTHDSIHSVAGMILFPWGYTTDHTPDDAIFRAIAAERASFNGYQTGQPPEILYVVSGGSFDWAYGEQGTKPKIFSFTTEIGGSGFWPAPSERDGLLAENLYSVIYLTQVAGPSISVPNLVVTGGNGNGRIEPGEAVGLVATVENGGIFGDLTDLTLRLRCDDPYVVLQDVSSVIGTLGPGESTNNGLDPFEIEAEAACPNGRIVTFTVVADAAGGLHLEVPFLMQIGELPVILANDFENNGEEWIQDASHTATSGAFVRVDPVQTGYQPGDDTTPPPGVTAWITGQNPGGADGTDDVDEGISATRSPDFALSFYESVRMSLQYFHGQRDTGDDPNGDFFRIDVSSDAGGEWVNLVLIGDVAHQAVWTDLTVDLEDYIDLTGQVRVRIQAADGSGPAGWADIIEAGIDDFYLLDGGSPNTPPTSPTLVSPPDGAPDVPALVTLTVGNATDADGDPLTYGFRIFADADLTELVASADGVPEGVGTTSWTVGSPLGIGTYYWRAYAEDPHERGIYMDVASFTVQTTAGAEDLSLAGTAVLRAEPNPAREGIRIRYLVPATLTSRLAVYDPQGREVRGLETVPSATGWHEIVWDGRDDAGRKVSSGSYWVRLWTPAETRTVRVVRVE